MDSALICVIMAEVPDSRMKSDYPTVLHEVAGGPLIAHVLEAAKLTEASRTIVVLGTGKGELIKPKLPRDIEFVEQKSQENILKSFEREVLVLSGNTPLLRGVTLKRLIKTHREKKAAATVLTAILHDPTGYGRVIRKESDRIAKIIQEKNTTIYEKAVEEADSRTYCFDASEVFSTKFSFSDVIESMLGHKKKVLAFMTEDRDEILSVSSREELAIVNKILHRRIARIHMENGVTIVDPETTFIDNKVKIGRDSVIYPFTILEGKTIIGKECRVGPGAHLVSAFLNDKEEVKHE